MRFDDFQALIKRMAAEVPPEFLAGIAEVVVSRRTVPHPVRAEIYTLGECVPLPSGESPDGSVSSRVVLYHGSFAALARLQDDFDWREEAWETLTHELRHHLEWRARTADLEAFDDAAEHNFARQDGEPFDPLFYQSGLTVAEGVYRIDEDYFIEKLVREAPHELSFDWHGGKYRIAVPVGVALPAFLTVEGVEEPPPGELVLVLRRRAGVLDLFRRTVPSGGSATAVRVG